MKAMSLDAILLRARDLLWCLAMSDVDGMPRDRQTLLAELGGLELKSAQRFDADLYRFVVIDLEQGKRK